MTTLPIKRIILYKHGVGYFERRGPYEGERLQLSFPRAAMDDVLKSLVALDLGSGQVRNIDFETPEDRAALIARGSIHLSDSQSLLDLLRDLRGRLVRCVLKEGKKEETGVEGLVVGVDYEAEEPLRRAIVSLYHAESRQVRTMPIDTLARVDLLDESAAADLSYFLRAAQSEEERRSATLHLSPGAHELLVGYIAPAPAWRVSYRLLFEQAGQGDKGAEGQGDGSAATPSAPLSPPPPAPPSIVLLQGWGLFDNQLDEDLVEVELSLMAGMPVSFRYRLYEPRTPERPLVEDEERTVSAPIFFAAAPPVMEMEMADMALGGAPMAMPAAAPAAPMSRGMARKARIAEAAESVQAAAQGDERGALFAYQVAHPVSVGRGQSAMVPIVSQRLPARRELLYRHGAAQAHPVASLRLENGTGLTLERGPVTVLEEGDYAGEAVLPFTRAGGELIVAYAVELGVKVEEQPRSERRLHGVRIKDEYAIFDEYELSFRTYQITSTLSAPAEVTIEHARLAGYELFKTRKPDEEGASFARWRVPCKPQARTAFTVGERRLVSRSEQVRGLTGAMLQRLLAEKLLDAATGQALEGVLDLYRQVGAAQGRLKQIERERETAYKQQRQIQGNLQPLGREGDEGMLRQRYVTTLNQIEDQLAALAAREAATQQEIAGLEARALERLRQLSAS